MANDIPTRDLWVSPEHAMYIDGMLIPAMALVDGVGITQDDTREDITSFHLEFDTHAILFAEGAPAESYVDDENRQAFDNAAEYAQLYPVRKRGSASFVAPRIDEGWDLQAIRERLAARDATLVLLSTPRRRVA